jgi:hypothetical protein
MARLRLIKDLLPVAFAIADKQTSVRYLNQHLVMVLCDIFKSIVSKGHSRIATNANEEQVMMMLMST